jgi:hypothetical protein
MPTRYTIYGRLYDVYDVFESWSYLPYNIHYNTQNQPGNKAKTSARHNGEHAAPSSPDSKNTKPTSTLFRKTVVRGLAWPGRKHAPLDLANIPTVARHRKWLPLTNPTLSWRRAPYGAPSTSEARETPPGPAASSPSVRRSFMAGWLKRPCDSTETGTNS